MRLAPHTRKLTLWIAACAVFLAALAPAITHVLHSGSQVGWFEICSAVGTKSIDAAIDAKNSGDPASDPGMVFGHCPYCSLHATTLGLPPTMPVALMLLSLRFEHPQAFFSAARTAHAWLAAQPRAPPLDS